MDGATGGNGTNDGQLPGDPSTAPTAGGRRADAALVEAARAGNKDAFTALVNRHRPMVLALVVRLTGSADAAPDVVQEAVVAALVNLDRLRDPARFGAWFAGIALNVARRWRREAVAVAPSLVDRPAADADPSEAAEAADLARDVRRAVASLPPGQREAVLAFYWGDQSHLEAAARLGITAGAVKSRLHQARTNLMPRLAPHAQPAKETSTMTSSAGSSERATPTWVPSEVADVRRSVDGDPARRLHVVLLRAMEDGRQLPIYLGAAEATALACTLESLDAPRPLTYAMAAGLLRAAGARVLDVRVTTLAEDTFYAVIRIEGPAGTDEVDARPSDALNLALVCNAPVLVEEGLFTADCTGASWRTAWQAFPSASAAIAAEIAQRAAELELLRGGRGGA